MPLSPCLRDAPHTQDLTINEGRVLLNFSKMAPTYSASPRLSQDICGVPGTFGVHGSCSLNHPSRCLLSSYNCSLSCSTVTQTPPFECPWKSFTQSIHEGNRCRCRKKLELNIKHLSWTAGVHPQCSSSEHTCFPNSSFEHAVQSRSARPAEPQTFRYIF